MGGYDVCEQCKRGGFRVTEVIPKSSRSFTGSTRRKGFEGLTEMGTKTLVVQRSNVHSFFPRSNGITLSHLVLVVFELAE